LKTQLVLVLAHTENHWIGGVWRLDEFLFIPDDVYLADELAGASVFFLELEEVG